MDRLNKTQNRGIYLSGLAALSIVLGSLITVGCASRATSGPSERDYSAMVSMSQPGFAVAPGARLAWLPEAVELHADPRLEMNSVRRLIESAVVSGLSARGYRLTASPDRADYLFAYVAALESALDDTAILTRFHLLPGMEAPAAEGGRYEKGTLILLLIHPVTRQPLWRVVTQVMADLELDDETRRRRINGLVERMVARIPSTL